MVDDVEQAREVLLHHSEHPFALARERVVLACGTFRRLFETSAYEPLEPKARQDWVKRSVLHLESRNRFERLHELEPVALTTGERSENAELEDPLADLDRPVFESIAHGQRPPRRGT